MSECPNCGRYKASASMWRNEAYRVAGHPLPWSPDEELLQRALDALNHVNVQARVDVIAALKARLEEKT